jgi:hypothetical protein
MKAKYLFQLAVAAFFLALGLLAAGWNGQFTVTAASHLSGWAVRLSGAAAGGWAVAGLSCFLVTVILLIWGMIRAVTGGVKRGRRAELPSPPPSPPSP